MELLELLKVHGVNNNNNNNNCVIWMLVNDI